MYNPDQLAKKLVELPSKIHEQELKVVEAKEKVEHAKILYSASFADKLLKADRPNATEKKSLAETLTVDEKTSVIRADTEFEKEKAHLNFELNKFNALRKVANIEIQMVSSQISGN